MKKNKSKMLNLLIFHRNIVCSVLFFAGLFIIAQYPDAYSQQINNIGGDGQYVDVIVQPPGQEQQAQLGPAVEGASWEQNNQINTGVLNYGLTDSVYYQFSGEDIFKDGNPLTGSIGFNWNWTHLNELDYKIPAAWSYGGEFLYFSSTSESTYSGKDNVTGSAIDMDLYMFSVAVKAFFMDPVREFLHPYLGFGWGLLTGSFKTTQNITGSKFDTSFNGVLAYQVLGVQIMLINRAGIMAEIKNMRANASTSNDPFDQASGSSVDLTFDGVIIGLTGFYRF